MKTQLKTQWQIYKELERIPDSISAPKTNKLASIPPLRAAWRLLIDALAQELIYEQQVEYLERCWTIGQSELDNDTNNTWHKLWTLMS